MVTYRTRTYIAGDWDNDKDAINQLRKWNDSSHWSLSFTDAHDLTSSRDSSLNCTIKSSLKTRMDASKSFVLIVGNSTASVKAGGCQLCRSYNGYTKHCVKGYYIDYRSFIEYECDEAINAGINIIVLYNATCIDKAKCPDELRCLGKHVAMKRKSIDGKCDWDYQSVKNAFDS